MRNAEAGAPIVLVHGILGFGQLKLAGMTVAEYFRGIAAALRAEGHQVPDPPTLNTAGSIAERAADLKRYLDTHPDLADGQQLHLIAHSMGGLDSRFLISKLGMANRVLSLTTIGTPHRGSPIADHLSLGTDPSLIELLGHVGIDVKGAVDLTTAACTRFNAEVPDSPGVRYFSVAGKFELNSLFTQFSLLRPLRDIIAREAGENDGLVSVDSARFGQLQENWTFQGTWPANHFRLINWGTNILPSSVELVDESILDKYRALAISLRRLSGT